MFMRLVTGLFVLGLALGASRVPAASPPVPASPSLSSPSSSSPAATLTLRRAFELAQLGNRSLATAAARLEEQEAALRIARAQRKPAVTFSQRLTRVDDSTVARANAAADGLSQLIGFDIPPFVFQDSYRTQFSLAVPLWASGEIAATIDTETQNLNAAEAAELVAWRTARREVTRRFFDLAASQTVIEARSEALRRAERRLQEARRRLELGLTTRQEVLRWQVEVEQGRADLADVEAALFVARLELADLLDVGVSEIGEPLLPDDDTLEALAEWAATLRPEETLERAEEDFDQLPEMRLALAEVAAGEARIERARAGRQPRLDASAAYGWLENETLGLDGFDNWSATLQFTLPIDLWGALRAEVARERARQDGAETAVEEARAALRVEVGRAIAEVVRTRTRLRSAQRAAEEAGARRGLLGRQAEVGLIGLLDLIDADTTLVTTEVALASARVDLLDAIAQLELVWPGASPPDNGLIP